MSLATPSHRRRTRLVDRIAAGAISAGGGMILLATALLVIFLVVECLPLLRKGSAAPEPTVHDGPALAATEDEYRETVAVVSPDATLRLVGRTGENDRLELEGAAAPLHEAAFSPDGRLLAVRDDSGRVLLWSWRQRVRWHGDERVLVPSLRPLAALGDIGTGALLAVDGDASRAGLLFRDAAGADLVVVADGEGETTHLAMDAPAEVGAMTSDLGQVWVAGRAQLGWFRNPAGAEMPPSAAAPLTTLPTAATVLLGDTTLLLGDDRGVVAGWQALAGEVAGSWVLDRSASFGGAGRVEDVASSQRDKSFAVLRPGSGVVDYLTTRERVVTLPSFPADAAILKLSPRLNGAYAVTAAGAVHRWSLDLHYPEASLATLFLPVRYEGYAKADLVWQSSGSTAGFEPKLSLIPLIVGTFKGALYALVFSAPLALAGALYVNQFASRRLREVVKPVVELMAAVPSVVVGFLAALFVAPLVREHLVFTLEILLLLPLITGLAMLWSAAPATWRRALEGWRELAAVGFILTGLLVVLYQLAGPLENALFGGDIEHWMYTGMGITYDQRNALVVGFALGFAVIPIIFTIAEDAFSNVPPSLVAASLALGATRWQAARTVVVPAASPGLFAAVMLGLGRAVGETMIVLMATGNTPIMSMSPFNGFRTMSASIAVELPEAPYGGTLYRVLILTALMLFVATFVINLIAAAVSERLRRRFGRLAG